MGGATDLLAGAKAVVVVMEPRLKGGRPKLLKKLARGHTLEGVASSTEMDSVVSDEVKMDAYGPEPLK